MSRVIPNKRFTATDFGIIIFAAILAAISVIYINSRSSNAKQVTVTTDEKSFTLDLTDDSVHEFKSNGYSFKAEIKDGEISITESDCPDGICKNTPAIGKKNGTIVCLPAKMIISCSNEEDINEKADAVIP